MLYYLQMAKKESEAARTFVKNVRLLMAQEGMTNANQLAAKTGVSKRHCAYILNDEVIPSLDVIEQVARAFKIPDAWQLLVPDLNEDTSPNEIREVVSSYVRAPKLTKDYVKGVMETPAQQG